MNKTAIVTGAGTGIGRAIALSLGANQGGRRIYSRAVCPGTTDTPFWDRIPQREADSELTLRPEEVAWVVERWLENPSLRAEDMDAEKPRKEIVIKRHRPFESWDGVIAIAHESHP